MSALALEPPQPAELPTAAPLARGIPAVYCEPGSYAGDPDGSFIRRFTSALDGVLAPMFCTLDSLPAYFDPMTAPEHFLDWLASWVGFELYERWPAPLRRTLIATAVHRHHFRGTKVGLAEVVATFTEVDAKQVTIEESGGVWERTSPLLDDVGIPEFPKSAPRGCWMTITVSIGKENYECTDEKERVTELVSRVAERLSPAHVRLRRVEVKA